MAKPAKNPDPAYQLRLAAYERIAETIPEVERKGAANPYTALNGNMFSYLHPSGAMALRLPPEAREAFLARYGTSLFEAYGVVQKEYVTVPDDLLADTAALAPHFAASFAYARTLKPKPTTKKKA